MSAKLDDDLLPAVRDLRSDVLEDEVLRLPVEHDLTARREEWEPLLNLSLEGAAGVSRQGSISLGEAELLALVADEVQHRQDSLRRRASEPTSELLEEDRCALGGAEHEDGVDVGDVEALVQHVDGEHRIDAARAEVVECRGTLASWRLTADRASRDSSFDELPSHVVGMGDAHAESERPHAANVRHLVPQLAEDDAHASVVAREDAGQLRFVVSALETS